ncbi:helix-turn-helix transcriptional regulator [Catellatospora sp. KI3]|uniref:helix-turn-helix transcriptional regulator n=1 Tax=Catellatospora sp. KI3 TaxID=3041620 RepID=UPI002482F65D|nr:helix-turn-helix transcriptional regulator [Catellatospora sp. KI3]MDI1462559.1 helix-turn-helix transcriptional regulator [Catellatospora sp. KI3]
MPQQNGPQDIGEFLRTRRARISPAQAGLPEYGRRRVAGLRREEIAQLAGVSVDYYTRLEQGRGTGVSDAVLDAIARVLRLDDTEHDHLRNLARPARPTPGPARPPKLRRELVRMLELMTAVPAFVLGRRMDVLAWNALADAIAGFGAMPAQRRNVAYQTFLNPHTRTRYRDWPAVAAETVAHLRRDAGRHPGDERLAALVGLLSVRDPVFAQLWAAHGVKEKAHGRKLLRHPVVGDLDFAYETFALPGDPGQFLVTYVAEAGSPTEERLRVLGSWAASQPAGLSSPDDARTRADLAG